MLKKTYANLVKKKSVNFGMGVSYVLYLIRHLSWYTSMISSHTVSSLGLTGGFVHTFRRWMEFRLPVVNNVTIYSYFSKVQFER